MMNVRLPFVLSSKFNGTSSLGVRRTQQKNDERRRLWQIKTLKTISLELVQALF